MMTEPDAEVRDWAEVRKVVVGAVIGFLGEVGPEGVARNPEALADAVLAVCDEEAVNRMAEQFVAESRMRALEVREGKIVLDAIPAREIVAQWAGASRTLLDGAENYAEIEMEFSVGGTGERYAFTLQKVGKLTPHQARQQAEARVAELEAQLRKDGSDVG